jgi:hypothetical protein
MTNMREYINLFESSDILNCSFYETTDTILLISFESEKDANVYEIAYEFNQYGEFYPFNPNQERSYQLISTQTFHVVPANALKNYYDALANVHEFNQVNGNTWPDTVLEIIEPYAEIHKLSEVTANNDDY